jgi:hypothetical protein
MPPSWRRMATPIERWSLPFPAITHACAWRCHSCRPEFARQCTRRRLCYQAERDWNADGSARHAGRETALWLRREARGAAVPAMIWTPSGTPADPSPNGTAVAGSSIVLKIAVCAASSVRRSGSLWKLQPSSCTVTLRPGPWPLANSAPHSHVRVRTRLCRAAHCTARYDRQRAIGC